MVAGELLAQQASWVSCVCVCMCVCACVCVQCAMYNLHTYLFPASSLYNGKYVYTPDPAIALEIITQYE